MKKYVILHNIRSAHNVGSIFRTADGAGVSKLYLTGYTPAPIDRFGRERNEILKTSLGASRSMSYEIVPDINVLIAQLQSENIHVVAIEQTPQAIEYRRFSAPRDTAFVFGNETAGIDANVLAQIDTHLFIPMHGNKESLNVSVCAGVILFQF